MTKQLPKIDATPHWPGMFRLGEQLIREADFNGKAFVLEMYQFGARCYDEIQRNKAEGAS